MKWTLFTILIVLSITAIIALSCKKEYSCEGCNTGNQLAIAVAGPDQLVTLPIDSVLLNGTASYDPDGNITKWQWTKIAGPVSFSINSVDSAKTVVGRLEQGIYQFELKVTDNEGAFDLDTVQITVNADGNTNLPPIACTGQNQTISLPVNSVLLDGSCSTDPNNNITSYVWTKVSGPASFEIANANVIQTQATNLVEGTYLFQLKVTDTGGLFSMDTVQVIVNRQVNNLPVDIYVAGDKNSVATYWKNGQQVTLRSESPNSAATSIAVVGTDVYVAGWEGDAFLYGNNTAKYWKNGQEVFLTGATGAGATSIAVAGGDVYVAGWEIKGSKTVAIYWKNSQPVTLTNGLMNAEATCIVVVSGNVYVSGYENGVAKYWKNTQPVILSNVSNQASANSIAVVGNDVYVAGSEVNGTTEAAKYWKNGQAVTLTNGSVYATATSIAVVGTDVYVAGWEGDFVGREGGLGSVAKYWKNEQLVALTNGTSYAYPSSIAFFGSDVYVSGTEFNGYLPVAKYWKNGPATPITLSHDAWANSILVVPR